MKISTQARGLVGQPMFAFKKKVEELERQGSDIVHLEIGDSHIDAPGVAKLACVNSILKNETHYTVSSGMNELKDKIVLDVHRNYGFLPKQEQVVVLPANAAIDFVIRCVCDPGDEVIVPDPCFPTYTSVLGYCGIRYRRAKTKASNKFRLKFEDVSSLINKKTRLVILNSPCNPTGSVMEAEDVSKITQLCKNLGIWVLSDEVYHGIAYRPVFSPASIDSCFENVILLRSFSKEFSMSGFRIGYVVAPDVMAQRVGLMVETILSCTPRFTQRAACAVLDEPEKYIERNKAIYKEAIDLAVHRINGMKVISCEYPDGGFYLWVDVSHTKMDDMTFQDFALDHGVALLGGSYFGSGDTHVRICLANTTQNLNKALDRLEGALCKF